MRRLAFVLTFALACNAAADGIIDDVLKAYGGAGAWSAIESIRQTGVVRTTMRGDAPLVRELIPPERLKIVIRYPSFEEVRIVNGRTGTRDGEMVTGPQLDAMRLQAARMDLPRLLAVHRASIIDRGVATRGDVAVHVLEIPLPDGLRMIVDVDRATKRIVHTTGVLPTPNGKSMAFENEYSDFRFVDGRLFAFREVSVAGGTVTGETRLATIEVKVRGQRASLR